MKNQHRSTLVSFLTCLLLIGLTSPLQARTLKGFESVDFKETLENKGKSLQLNGLGARLATIFNVKVYVAGLYLEEKSQDAQKIINSPGPKVLKMHFVRDVSKDQLSDAWEDGFKKNADKAQLATFDKRIEELKSFTPTVKEGDNMEIHFRPTEIEVYYNNQFAGKIAGEDFSKTMLSIWLGSNPPNKELKEGLLGDKK